MLLEKGQIADAISRYQEALANDPNFADAHRQLAVALERSGRALKQGWSGRKQLSLTRPNPDTHSRNFPNTYQRSPRGRPVQEILWPSTIPPCS
jgi:Tfp pilus assembly protein PilF